MAVAQTLMSASQSASACRGCLHRRPVAVVASAKSPRSISTEATSSKRAMLSMLVASGAMLAIQPAAKANRTDISRCVDAEFTYEDERNCRRNILSQDAGKQEDYGKLTSGKAPELAPNVPVAALDDEYSRTTLKLAEAIEQYCTAEVYDKTRPPLVKALKADGTNWVVKYARGGSARSQSARRMYIAVDAVVGHIASNGLAPLPPPKVKFVLKSLAETRELLAKGI